MTLAVAQCSRVFFSVHGCRRGKEEAEYTSPNKKRNNKERERRIASEERQKNTAEDE